jgi:tRNA-dihydrouridine synthase 2
MEEIVLSSSPFSYEDAPIESIPCIFPPSSSTSILTTWSSETYSNSQILAPMVRASTLPLRILAQYYGAKQCYSEELIDKKLQKCTRIYDSTTNLIHFIPESTVSSPSTTSIFTTFENEPVAVQLGTSNGVDALRAAEVVANDVRAIDINMGCPKVFSIQGGMGSALLKNPEAISDILSTLRRNLSIPITCKIRLLEDEKSTVEILRRAESVGIAAIAVHARHVPDRPYHRALRTKVALLPSTVNIPVIINGDIFVREDITSALAESQCSSVMIARGAFWNASVFRSDGMLPLWQVVRTYADVAMRIGHFPNAKFCIGEMMKDFVGTLQSNRLVISSKNWDQMITALRTMHTEIKTHTSENKSLASFLNGPYCPPDVNFSERPEVVKSSTTSTLSTELPANPQPSRELSKRLRKERYESKKMARLEKKRAIRRKLEHPQPQDTPLSETVKVESG